MTAAAGYVPVDIAAQSEIVIKALVLGVLLGVLYDFFRISRIAFKTPQFVILLEDLLFFGLVTVISFSFVITVSGGVIRIVCLVAEAAGAVVYYFTLGSIVMKISSAIIGAIKAVIGFFAGIIFAVLRFLHSIIIKPAIKFIVFIAGYICKPFRAGLRFAKKICIKFKNLLKKRREVLYNQEKKPIPPLTRDRK